MWPSTIGLAVSTGPVSTPPEATQNGWCSRPSPCPTLPCPAHSLVLLPLWCLGSNLLCPQGREPLSEPEAGWAEQTLGLYQFLGLEQRPQELLARGWLPVGRREAQDCAAPEKLPPLGVRLGRYVDRATQESALAVSGDPVPAGGGISMSLSFECSVTCAQLPPQRAHVHPGLHRKTLSHDEARLV